MKGATTRFPNSSQAQAMTCSEWLMEGGKKLAPLSSIDCAKVDGFVLICLTTNRWCAASALSEYTPHIYTYIYSQISKCMNLLCQSGMSYALCMFSSQARDSTLADEQRRNGASCPWCFFGTDAWRVLVPRIQIPYRKVQTHSKFQSELVPWSFQFWYWIALLNLALKTNPIVHLVVCEVVNNLDIQTSAEKCQFFWAASLGN